MPFSVRIYAESSDFLFYGLHYSSSLLPVPKPKMDVDGFAISMAKTG